MCTIIKNSREWFYLKDFLNQKKFKILMDCIALFGLITSLYINVTKFGAKSKVSIASLVALISFNVCLILSKYYLRNK